MYNEERKRQFMQAINKPTESAQYVFNATQKAEEEFGKDLCELPAEVLQSIVNKKFGVRTRSVEIGISVLQSYEKWCIEQGYPSSNVAQFLTVDTTEKVRRMMVASPQHLNSILNTAFTPVEAGTVDCLYRCYLWMAFSGLTEEEALKVTVEEIDFGSMLIHHAGSSLDLYREAVPAFRMACEATEFVYDHNNYSTKKARASGGLIMRGIRSESIKTTTTRAFIRKRFNAKGIETSFNKIYLSGVFYKAYETERCGGSVNFDIIIKKQIDKKPREYNSNYTMKKAWNSIEKSLRSDYDQWKEAFRV